MSRRADIRDAIVAKLQGLGLGAPVGTWTGDPEDFNEEESFPSVWVLYAGAQFGDWQTLGPSTPVYERAFGFAVFVAATSETEALGILEAIEQGLPGTLTVGSDKRRVELDGEEELIAVELGRYLYGQRYRVPDP